MVNGVFWSAIEKYSGLVVSIIVSMILARILTPYEYGVVAIATVLIHFLQMFSTMGIGPAVIQRNDLTKEDLNSIFTFSVFLGIVLSIVFFISSWWVAKIYKNDQLTIVCQLLTVQVFFSAVNMVPSALMYKNKKFKSIARRTLILQSISGTISIILAISGAGIFSLLFSPIFTSIGIFIWNWHFFHLFIDLKFNMLPVKQIFPFSFFQFMFDFVNYFSRNLDKLIIGKILPLSELGLYEKSYRLMQLPMNNLTSVINPVIQPVLSPLQNNKLDLALKYNKLIHFIACISFPLGAFLYTSGNEIIHLFYGGRWDAAINTFKILSLSVPLQLVLSTTGGIFQSSNATKQLFYAGLRNTAMTITGFILAAVFFGTKESIAWGWTLSSYLCFLSSFIALYYIVFKVSIISMLKELMYPFINMMIIICVMELVESLFITNEILRLCCKIFLTLFVTILFLQMTNQFDIIKFINKRFL